MKNAAKPNLRKAPERGEKVTARTSSGGYGYVVRGRVSHPFRRGLRIVYYRDGRGPFTQRLLRRDEGAVWVRGWDTEEALAMIVGEALR